MSFRASVITRAQRPSKTVIFVRTGSEAAPAVHTIFLPVPSWLICRIAVGLLDGGAAEDVWKYLLVLVTGAARQLKNPRVSRLAGSRRAPYTTVTPLSANGSVCVESMMLTCCTSQDRQQFDVGRAARSSRECTGRRRSRCQFALEFFELEISLCQSKDLYVARLHLGRRRLPRAGDAPASACHAGSVPAGPRENVINY